MDLTTTYLGLELKHPIAASAGPLSSTLDGIRRLEEGGAAAVVLFSLFEEHIRHENESFSYLYEQGAERFPESLSYFPEVEDYYVGPEGYLNLVRSAVEATDIPIIGSLNGITDDGWTEYAREIEAAGASALELNIFYIPADISVTGREVEERYVRIVRRVKSAVGIPVAVKLSPFFSSTGEMARRLAEAGADGLALFNRFYQPDFDLDALEVRTTLELSGPNEIRLPLLWIAVLHGRLDVSLAATTGVEGVGEAIKYLMAGADVVMTTSALLRHGPGHIETLVNDVTAWMERRGYESVRQMKGSMSQQKVEDPTAFERANYIKMLESYKSPYLT
ncbi:MAG TPA: dihydroorotate dehydrogenase-like protein [Rubrobacteraceae bacterium]|nr:dihydroorotate dehydrogenase-like protein [Rubrobacteraceae bacterium]